MDEASQPRLSGLAGEFDLKYAIRLLWGGRATIVAIGLLGLGVGFLLTYLQTPIYRAQALVRIDPPGQNLSALSNPYPTTALNWFDYHNYYNTQYRIIRSKALAEKVLERLDLADKAPFRDAADPPALLLARLEVVPVPDTRLAQIAVLHEDPGAAASWANAFAEAYVEQNLESKIEATRNVYGWLQERLAAAESDVQQAEQKLYEYTKTQDLFVPEEGPSIASSTLERLNAAHTEAKTRRIELESTLAQIRKLEAEGQSLDALPQIAADPLVQNLNLQRAELEVELVQLKNKYKEGHPKVKKIRSQMERLREAIDAQAAKIVEGLEADYQQLRRREQQLLASMNRQKRLSLEETRKSVRLEMLQREAISNKNLYEAILQKIKETDIAASLRNNNVSIVERASVPGAPTSPQPAKNLSLALLLGLATGCGLVLLRDYLDNTLKEQEDIETHLRADCLAVVPRHDAAHESIVTEAYRTLRTSLLFGRTNETSNVVLVTSSIPQEGKSTTAVGLARAFAESGEPTLLVDLDLRRSSVHRALRLYREPGLSDYCARDLSLDLVVQRTRHEGLFAVTSGKLPPNPPALLGGPSLARFLERCREDYPWIILDAPPVASVTDPLLLAKLADLVLLVVRYNEVDRKLARRCWNSLRRTEAHLAGVVLNGVDPKQDSYHRYYSYYQQADPAEPKKAKVTRIRRPAVGER